MLVFSLLLDGVSTAYLGPYGAEWSQTPVLNGLASDGVVFDRCYCPCDSRVAGNRALSPVPFANAAANVVHVRESDHFGDHSLKATLNAAFERLGEPSNADALISIELKLHDCAWRPRAALLERHLEHRAPVDLTGSLVGWLDQDVSEDEIDALRDTYTARMEELDACLAGFFGRLQEAGLYDKAAVFFSALAGWPLGEHGMIGPAAPWAHEERDHVPLIVKFPGCRSGTRCNALVSTADIVPAMASLVTAEPLDRKAADDEFPLELADLLSLARGQSVAARELLITGFAGVEVGVRTANWKLIVPSPSSERTMMLFQSPSDRWEFSDLIGVHADIADALSQRIPHSLRPGAS